MSKIASLRFGLRGVFLAVTALAVVIWSIRYVQTKVQINSAEDEVISGLVQLSDGLVGYRYTFGESKSVTDVIDANGSPILSWRVRLLNAITSPPIACDFGASWNSPTNRLLAAWPCWVYCSAQAIKPRDCETIIYAVRGEDTAFDANSRNAVSEIDGDAILMMDVADSGTHWMEPGDFQVKNLLACTGRLRDCVKGTVAGRAYVLFADGEVWCLRNDVPMDIIKPFLTLHEAARHSREEMLGKYRLQKWKAHGIVVGEGN